MNLITPQLTFEPLEHVYTLDGRKLPSVTHILSKLGLIEEEWFTEESRNRGTAVHEAIHYLNEDDLDWSSIRPDYLGYIEAYERFCKESGFEPLGAEWLLAHKKLHYAGALDAFGLMVGEKLVIDYKTGGPAPWHCFQGAGYIELLRDNAGELGLTDEDIPERALVCHLRKDGNYKLVDPCQDSKTPITWRQARAMWLTTRSLCNFHPQLRAA